MSALAQSCGASPVLKESRTCEAATLASAAQAFRYASRLASLSARRSESSSTFVSRSRERMAVMACRWLGAVTTGRRG
jgi:hypothetical protein